MNPYESPRETEGYNESKPRPEWLDALPGLAVIFIIMLSPILAQMLPDFGILHWPMTLTAVVVAAVGTWAIIRKAIG